MPTLLHLDSSARPGYSDHQAHGSHSRRLTRQLVERVLQRQPDTKVVYRDIGANPPPPVTGDWIHAAFTPAQKRQDWMHDALALSDELVAELKRADAIVMGVPMYNFGPPAGFKAYLDNIVRVGLTFGFDRSRSGEPYWPLLSELGQKVVLVSSRGDYGYDDAERIQHWNHVEPAVEAALRYIGITNIERVSVEYDEFADERLQQSLRQAEQRIDQQLGPWLVTR
ncbi:NAD(P)H dehydrogenase [Bacterioplanes sanyensis]|uniref:FMN dependent NADH:quinone oxidoreductase n=1 Tax=Bacterioplanes sanyensis TaxID=1249553 RepID=A0A222FMX8_9GAMM|nr:NAD(P)H-dependent oxidoreductase [Bacterioplanes sanyensis]ASP40109.1 NAD(P)H dehydrogenase [Bacterioplanes sanyensis]